MRTKNVRIVHRVRVLQFGFFLIALTLANCGGPATNDLQNDTQGVCANKTWEKSYTGFHDGFANSVADAPQAPAEAKPDQLCDGKELGFLIRSADSNKYHFCLGPWEYSLSQQSPQVETCVRSVEMAFQENVSGPRYVAFYTYSASETTKPEYGYVTNFFSNTSVALKIRQYRDSAKYSGSTSAIDINGIFPYSRGHLTINTATSGVLEPVTDNPSHTHYPITFWPAP